MTTEAGDKTYKTAQEGPELDPSRKPPKSGQETKWAMICHLAALAGYVLPVGNVVGPLVVWMMKRKESGFVNRQGKEVLNFQISMTVYALIAVLIPLLGVLLVTLIALVDLILLIMAAVRAKEGVEYRYPLAFRLIK
jgi:hypothetical protein